MAVLAFLWPVLGLAALALEKKPARLVIFVIGLLCIMMFQLSVTWEAMFTPMYSLITGMAEMPEPH